MDKLDNKQLMKVSGGGFGTALLITAGVVFLIGVIDGYVRPMACN